MADDRLTWLGKLKRAVKKIQFLLNFNILNRLKLASIIGTSSSKRRLSFNDNDRPGLRACVDESGSDEESGSSRRLQRTTSYPSSEDIDIDIDKRADAFIANFYKQLQYERQISLQLRYYRAGNTFDSSTSPHIWIPLIKILAFFLYFLIFFFSCIIWDLRVKK